MFVPYLIYLLALFYNCVSSVEIFCNNTQIILPKGEKIDPIECIDNNTPHLNISVAYLPNGLSFDGRIICGTILESFYNHHIVVFNNDSSVLITVNTLASPTYVDYGFDSINVYNEMAIDPFRPTSDAWIEEFICSTPLMDGLFFNNKTGEISGVPIFNYSSTVKTVNIVGRNSLGSVSTRLTFYFYRSYHRRSGINLCILPLSSALPNLIPELFDTAMDRSCSIQSTLSWANTVNNPNPLLPTPFYSFLRFSGYIDLSYAAPTTFILSTFSSVIVLLDNYTTPLLQTEATTSMTDYRVTIRLNSTYHRIVVYIASTSKSAFSLYYAFHTFDMPETLITSNVMSLIPNAPRYISIPQIRGFAHQPFDIYFHSWYPISSTTQIGSYAGFLVAGKDHLHIDYPEAESFTAQLQVVSNGGYSFISVPVHIDNPRIGYMVSVIEEGIKQQKLVDSLSDFSIEEIPSTVAVPMIEVNATLFLQSDSSFSIDASSCELFLDDLPVEEVIYPLSSSSVYDFHMRCSGRKALPSIHFSSQSQNWTQPILASPRSRFSFIYPVYHCTVNQVCNGNSILTIPEGCQLTPLTPLPFGFTLTENGTLVGISEVSGVWDVKVGCIDSSESTDLSIIIENEVKAPTALTLSIDGVVIDHTLQVTLGRSMIIDVNVNEMLGVAVESVPPLPSSLHLTSTSLTGVLTNTINQVFTLTARNVKGEVSKVIQIVSDPCNPYTLHLLRGNAYMHVRLNDETVHNSIVSEGFLVTVCTEDGALTLHTMCQSVQGCWLQLESGNLHELPRYVHYREETDMSWILPMQEFDVVPVVTNAASVVGWPISTLLWSVNGLIDNTTITGLPEWVVYDPLENSLNGIAETSGLFEGDVVVNGYNDSYSFHVMIDIIDALELNRNLTVVSIVETNDLHSNEMTVFSFNSTDLISNTEDISSLSSHSIMQVLLLPEGFMNFTFSTSDALSVEFRCGEVQIARRDPYQDIAFIYLQWAIASYDEWRLWPDFDPVPSRWYSPSLDDEPWNEVEISDQESQSGMMYLRRHFVLSDVHATRLGVIVKASSGVVVYLNGALVWRSHVSSGCAKDKYECVSSRHFIKPFISSFIAPITPLEDNVIAVQLVGKQSDLQRFSFQMTAFSISSPLLLSSVTHPPTRSPSVYNNDFDPASLVSPFTSYNYGMSMLPSFLYFQFPYCAPLSRLVLYSSASNIIQQPTWIVISGISEGDSMQIGSVHHSYLWDNTTQPLYIHLDSSAALSSLTISMYAGSIEGNRAHYFGAVQLASQEEVFCEAVDGFPSTWEKEHAVIEIRTEKLKGYYQRTCLSVVNQTNPLDVHGEWSAVQNRTVNIVPPRGTSYVEFALRFVHMQERVVFMHAADDLIEGCMQYFNAGIYMPKGVSVYGIRDDSTVLESIFTIWVQIQIQPKHAEALASHIKQNSQNLLLAMQVVSQGRYLDVSSVALSVNPVVINHPKEKWEIILEVCIICIVVLLLSILIWVKRKTIVSTYRRITMRYRHDRRVEVLEELGLPIDMSYLPKESINPDARVFETPYGNICLVKPIVPFIPPLEGDFVEA